MITSRKLLLAAFGLALPLTVAGVAPTLAATTSQHKPVHHVTHKTTTHKTAAHKTTTHKHVARKSPTHHPMTKKPS